MEIQFSWRSVRRFIVALALLVGAGVPAFYRLSSAAPAVVHAAGGSCTFGNGIKHVVNIIFDNVHYERDPDRFGNTNVPSDLEQMPNLLHFMENNGTLLTNDHTPLISHTSDDIITGLTGVYPSRHGVATAANSYQIYNPNGSTSFQSGFTYWTTLAKDGVYNLLSGPVTTTAISGTNAPAPWVPFTRAGCSVGAYAAADMELENTTSDVANVYGVTSTQAMESSNQKQADFDGIAIHCAQGDTLCSPANGGKPDVLPTEPGGYAGYSALFGNKYVGPAIAGTTAITDINGTPISNTAAMTYGFPGFSPSAAQSLGYVSDMLEKGVPVVYLYIITAHNSITSSTAMAFGPGQQGYEEQLQQYNDAFGKFFQRMANDGITPANTLYSITSDEQDHFVGGNPSPPNCDGATVSGNSVMTDTLCNYSQIGELNVNLGGLLQAEQGVTTPASVTSDDAPDIYLTNNPGPSDPSTRAYERATAALTLTNPLSTTLGVSSTDTLVQYMANPVEMRILHMLTFDPNRTPTFTAFAQPDYYVTGSTACGTSPTPATACVSEQPGFAWNHGDVQPQITNTWLGLVGPCVFNNGVDSATFADHTDMRPTELALLGLADDYQSDGRALVEDLNTGCLSSAVHNDESTFTQLAGVYKQITAPLGQLGWTTLISSTQAMSSGSAGDDSTFNSIEGRLTAIANIRDTLAMSMSNVLSTAVFSDTTIDDGYAQCLINQGNALLAGSTSAGTGCTTATGSATPTMATGTVTATGTASATAAAATPTISTTATAVAATSTPVVATNTAAPATNTAVAPTRTSTAAAPTGTAAPTSTAVPATNTTVPATNTPVPPSSTAAPATSTSTVAAPTGTAVPTTSTSTPLAPTSTSVAATSTGTATPPASTSTAVPPTVTPTPCRVVVPLRVSAPGQIHNGQFLTVTVHTAALARVIVSLYTTPRHPRLYAQVSGAANRRGVFVARFRIRLTSHLRARIYLTVRALKGCGRRTRTRSIVVLPPVPPCGIHVSLRVSVPSSVRSGALFTIGAHTLPLATVGVTLRLGTRILAQVQGRAGRHGFFSAGVRITYRPARTAHPVLLVVARKGCGVARLRASITLRR